MKPLFVLIDSNALIHRSFHAIPHLTTKDGTPINAAYGFTMTLLSAIKELSPTHIAAAFDVKEPTFRHIAYKEYKAHRAKAPDELYAQIPIVKDILHSLNIPVFEKPGLEADDIIGILAQQIKQENISVMIVTGDMDSLQLVDELVKVYTLKKGLKDTIIYNPSTVKQRFGFEPKYLIHYKALRGDPSDNIPGVKGIGEKTASALIQKFHTIEKLYDFLDHNPSTKEIKPAVLKKLIEQKDQAFLSKKLATIIIDQPLPNFDLQACEIHNYDQQQAIDLFQKLEFKSLISRLPQATQKKEKDPEKISQTTSLNFTDLESKINNLIKTKKYITINTLPELEKLLPKLSQGFTFDTETSDLDLFNDTKLVGISICIKPNEAYYLPLNHIDDKINLTPINLPKEAIELLKPIFANPSIPKNAHNAKFDIQALALENIDVKGLTFDTILASYLLNPNLPSYHKLDNLALIELGHHMIPITDLIGKPPKQNSFADIDIKSATVYSAEDSDISETLKEKFTDTLKKEKLWEVFTQLEIPLSSVLATIEQHGIMLDTKYLNKLNQEITSRIDSLAIQIHQQAGQDFNISSTQQLSQILFRVLHLSTDKIKKTKTGISTASSELDKLQQTHSIIPLIQEYRLLSKLKNTYVDTLPALIKKDGKIHTSFNQTVTATGRLSSSNPNLQNIPTKTEIGNQIRKAFIAPPQHFLLSADYSQIELRLMAHIAKEPNMIKAFQEDLDIHLDTAAKIYHCPLEHVTKEMRYNAKTINFSIIYGAGPRNISGQLQITTDQAKQFITEYFAAFPQIKDYMEKAITFAQKNNYSQTLFGRKRPIPEINSRAPQIKAQAERIAINTPIQGTAADLIKLAMIRIHEQINQEQLPIKMLLQVHDELIFEIPTNFLSQATKIIKHQMESVAKLSVPLKVDLESGQNWGEMEKIN